MAATIAWPSSRVSKRYASRWPSWEAAARSGQSDSAANTVNTKENTNSKPCRTHLGCAVHEKRIRSEVISGLVLKIAIQAYRVVPFYNISMTVRSVCGRHLSCSTDAIATRSFYALLVRIGFRETIRRVGDY